MLKWFQNSIHQYIVRHSKFNYMSSNLMVYSLCFSHKFSLWVIFVHLLQLLILYLYGFLFLFFFCEFLFFRKTECCFNCFYLFVIILCSCLPYTFLCAYNVNNLLKIIRVPFVWTVDRLRYLEKKIIIRIKWLWWFLNSNRSCCICLCMCCSCCLWIVNCLFFVYVNAIR